MSADLARAVRFVEAMRERMAGVVEPWRYGTALRHPGLPLVRDLNCARLARTGDVSKEEIAAACSAWHRGAGLRHARLDVGDDAAGARLASAFAASGWSVSAELVMVLGARPEQGLVPRVVELDTEELIPKWERGIRTSVADEETAAQLLEAQLLRERAVAVRYFGVRCGGRVVSECSLFSDGRVAQVESVHTVPEHRGRGHARAVVSRAVDEAVRAGHALVFLRADAEDWPQELYRRLGFVEVGRVWEFLRAGEAPPARRLASSEPVV